MCKWIPSHISQSIRRNFCCCRWCCYLTFFLTASNNGSKQIDYFRKVKTGSQGGSFSPLFLTVKRVDWGLNVSCVYLTGTCVCRLFICINSISFQTLCQKCSDCNSPLKTISVCFSDAFEGEKCIYNALLTLTHSFSHGNIHIRQSIKLHLSHRQSVRSEDLDFYTVPSLKTSICANSTGLSGTEVWGEMNNNS